MPEEQAEAEGNPTKQKSGVSKSKTKTEGGCCCNKRKKGKKILYGQPIEEIDPFVFEDTFCVISKKFGKHYINRFSASRSLYIFSPLNPIRKIATRIISNQLFDVFIISIILINCVTLALTTNWEIGTSGEMFKDHEKEEIIDHIEIICLTVYSFELTVKVIAKGFVINKFSYLRSTWNILDFMVVASSYVTISIEKLTSASDAHKADYDFFSTFRVLRAIKTFSIFPGLRTMINALLSSIRQLLEVMLLTLFCLMIFSLLALQLFMGKLKQKCVLIKNGSAHWKQVEDGGADPSELVPVLPSSPYVHKEWFDWVYDETHWLHRKDSYPKDDYVPCSNSSGGRGCDDGFVCLPNVGDNFDEGWTSFDTFFNAMLSTFQLLTLDFWERLYELVLSSTNSWNVIYFILVIFLGSFYLINLMLAVVAMSYEQEVDRATESALGKAVKLSVHRKASTFSFDDPRKLNVVELTRYERRTPEQREFIAKRLRKLSLVEKDSTDDMVVDPNAKPGANLQLAIMTLLGRRLSMESNAKSDDDSSDSNSDKDKKPLSKNSAVVTPPMYVDGVKVNEEPNAEPDAPGSNTLTFAKLLPSKQIFGEPDKPTRFARFVHGMRGFLTPVVNSVAFEAVITVMIVINTILLSSEHHNQPDWLTKVLDRGNKFFTAIFTFEAVIKILALQKEYFASKWNIFDFLLVIMSLADSSQDSYDGIRGMRILRVFKLAQSWITMKVLLTIIFSTFGGLANLILVLLIVIYIFAVLGLQVVGRHYTRGAFEALQDEEQFPRWNFQNFWYAFMMVFRVLCGEWIEPLWDCLKATAETSSHYKCFLIFLPILVVGNFIVLNLFLALLLNSFDTEELNSQREKEKEAAVQGKVENLKKIVDLISLNRGGKSSVSARRASRTTVDSVGSEKSEDIDNRQNEGRLRFQKVATKVVSMNREEIGKRMTDQKSLKEKQQSATKSRVSHSNTLFAKRSNFAVNTAAENTSDSGTRPDTVAGCCPQKILVINCCFLRCLRRQRKDCGWGTFRLYCFRIVSHPFFEWFILALIFGSSTTLCFEDIYLEERKTLQEVLFYLNNTFTCIFILEMFLKWFALGIFDYFTSAWTILDFVIVLVSVVQMAVDLHERVSGQGPIKKTGGKYIQISISDLAALKALRTLRALRPLRAISRWQGMKIVVNALMYAIPSIVNVLLVCLLFWLIFAIMGVQFFKGKFYKCVDNDDGEVLSHYVVANRDECCNNTNEWSWVNQQPNFDNVFQGYLTLFQVATFEGWIEAMRASIDSTEINVQPRRDNALRHYVFYVVFIMFGAFFTLNLFIGVIIDNFNRLKKKYEGSLVTALLTPSQRQYYTAMKQLTRKKPKKVIKRPSNKFLALFYDISMSRRFEIAIFFIIFSHMAIMAMETYNQRQLVTNIQAGFNSFFTAIYCVETVVKIIGLRQYYFTVPWNFFDFVLVVATLFDLAAGEDANYFVIPPTMLRIVRVFRIGRVLRLIKAAKGIRKLLFALIVSLPALFNIGALLGLVTFIYAILGMALFGKIAKNTALDEVFNFETFQRSCMMLLRLMTAAGWNDVLTAMTPETPVCGSFRNIKCGRPGEAECANVGLAVAYMVSYLFISFLVIINMYIAIILENFEEASREEEVGIVEDDLEMFYIQWSRYDPQATQFINFDQLSEFLSGLDPPLGLPKPNIVAIVAFNLPIAKGNKLHCLDILYSLVKHVIGHVDDSDEFRRLQEQLEHDFRKQFPTRKLLEIISSTRIWKIQHNAAIIIQRAWRAYRLRKYGPRDRSSSGDSIGNFSTATHHRGGDHHGVLNKMGNLLHVGHHPPNVK